MKAKIAAQASHVRNKSRGREHRESENGKDV